MFVDFVLASPKATVCFILAVSIAVNTTEHSEIETEISAPLDPEP